MAAVRDGHIRRLIINVPPRHLKSHLAPVAFLAWCFGHELGLQDPLCQLRAGPRRQIIGRLPAYPRQRLVPAGLCDPPVGATASRVRVRAGPGADIIIIDDPLKPEEALSQAQRQGANDWFDHTRYSRLNDTGTGAIILIMHRLHEDDLAGHVLAQEDWEVVRFRRSPKTTRPGHSRPRLGSQ